MKNVLLYCILTFSLSIFAQEKDRELPKANEEYALKNMLMRKLITEFLHLISPKKLRLVTI